MSHLKNGHLNLLLLRQSYISRKLQQGNHGYLAQLLLVQSEINKWYENECEKVKIQSRIEDVESPESVRIYHHELHARKIKKIHPQVTSWESIDRRSQESICFPGAVC